jgi:hypothetical protein
MLPTIRLLSQQLARPAFDTPEELVAWMGAIQAQDYNASKWAIGIRLKAASLQTVEDALGQGKILRTHVMRPTWHLVAASDIRWMLKLSSQRIKQGSASRDRDLEITENLYTQVNNLLEKILAGNNHLTRGEISIALANAGIKTNVSRMIHFMMRAEVEGVVCSGIDKGKKQTYALLEERVPPVKELHKEEALGKLAVHYFRSHSPASLADFAWWSGLSVSEARQAISLIESELIKDKFAAAGLFVHESLGSPVKDGNTLHLLPPFDEYLISYKDRTSVLDLKYYPQTFSTNGIFYPVVAYNGKIVGSWSKSVKAKQLAIDLSFFVSSVNPNGKLLDRAKALYAGFVG